jgi:NAD(P)-dependent dehydrogenase (short-subunit alcohol dehydrogenase family)
MLGPRVAQLFDLTGRLAVVTASGGKGCVEIVEMLGAAGALVVVADRDAETAGRMAAADARAIPEVADIENEGAVVALFDRVLERHGVPDILVNCAGMSLRKPFTALTLEEWDAAHSINVRANFLCMREALRQMVTGGKGGAIVNINTIGAVHPTLHENAAYSSARAGVSMLGRNAALDYASARIRVNTILAGSIPDKVTFHGGKEDRPRSGPLADPTRKPLGGGEMQDLAAAVLYLVADSGRYVTGIELPVEGGFFVS